MFVVCHLLDLDGMLLSIYNSPINVERRYSFFFTHKKDKFYIIKPRRRVTKKEEKRNIIKRIYMYAFTFMVKVHLYWRLSLKKNEINRS